MLFDATRLGQQLFYKIGILLFHLSTKMQYDEDRGKVADKLEFSPPTAQKCAPPKMGRVKKIFLFL